VTLTPAQLVWLRDNGETISAETLLEESFQ